MLYFLIIDIMATYTITINERTKEGKSLLNYLDSLGLICQKPDKNAISEAMKKKIDKAIEDERRGQVMRFGSLDKLRKHLDTL